MSPIPYAVLANRSRQRVSQLADTIYFVVSIKHEIPKFHCLVRRCTRVVGVNSALTNGTPNLKGGSRL